MSPAPVVLLADHPLVTTMPFFVPALVVAAVIGVVVWRDRRRGSDD